MRKRFLWFINLTPALLVLGATIASSQETAPATTDSNAGQAASTTESVEVTARREALRKAVASFVSIVTRDEGTNTARWRDPICLWVAGASFPQQNFIKSRVGEIARSVGAPVNADAECSANLLVFLTTDPNELVKQLKARSPKAFNNASPREIDKFSNGTRPVRVWQNSSLKNADGSPEIRYTDRAPQYRLRDSHIVSSVAEELAAVIVVVDTTRTGDVTVGQLTDYIAMVALAEVDMDAELADSPTILRIFANPSSRAPPAQLTDWDHAFLKAVYGMRDTYLQEESAIATRMTKDLDTRD